MDRIRSFPTDFSKYLYLYSSLDKNVVELFNSRSDIFWDIAHSFCVRSKIILVESTMGPFQHPVVVIRTYANRETLELYHTWFFAWQIHGYAAPFLDIQYIED